jgi:hypothetical protein
MNNFTENSGAQFANGQVGCDLRGNSDTAESETHLDPVEVSDAARIWRRANFPLQSASFWG